MNDHKEDLILKEYEISKDSIKSVMTQLIAVTASLLTVTIVILKLIFDEDGASPTNPKLMFMVILLVNFIAGFMAYQNIQIIALQKHIKSLESKLAVNDIFRWESIIARVWYDANSPIAVVFNVLLVIPPIMILVLLYLDFYSTLKNSTYFFLTLSGNGIYLLLIAICTFIIIRKLDKIFIKEELTQT